MATSAPARESRLASWKAIADYLGRSPRTVQRWLADYGLPVRRLGGSSGPIFAYTDELDGWLRQCGRAARLHTPSAAEKSAASGPSPAESLLESPMHDFQGTPGLRRGRSAELTALARTMWETLSSSDFGVMIRILRDAVDLDPSNADAFAGLSFALLMSGLWGGHAQAACLASAQAALRRAQELDASALETGSARSWIKLTVEHDWRGARHAFNAVLKRAPGHVQALTGQALLRIAEGSLKEASHLLQEVSAQNPLSAPTLLLRCWTAILEGNSAGAVELIAQARVTGHSGPALDALEALASLEPNDPERSLARMALLGEPSASQPPHPLLRGVMGYCHAAAGQMHETQKILHDFTVACAHGAEDCSYPLALVFIALNDHSSAMRWLRQSYAEGSLWSLGFPADPLLAPLRRDPLCQVHLNLYPSPGHSASRLVSVG